MLIIMDMMMVELVLRVLVEMVMRMLTEEMVRMRRRKDLYLICMVRWSRMSIELVEMTNKIGTN